MQNARSCAGISIPTESTKMLLQVVGMHKEFGEGAARVQAVRGVDVSVEAGEFLAVMGPSGCGKSTLLHVLGGVEPPTSGQVLLDGADLGNLSDAARSVIRRRRIGFVFQKMNLLPTLSSIENVALPLQIDGVARRTALQRAEQILDRVGLADRRTHFPHELSGGEQQRVAIARALIIEPAVLLADEPTGALDSANGQRVMELLCDCVAAGQTVVMVTHDPGMAERAARRITMKDGQIVASGDATDVSSAPMPTGAE